MKEKLHEIADKIETRVLSEQKVNAANRAIGGGEIISDNKLQNIWILNREIKSTAIIQKDITGQFRGTTASNTVEVLKDGGIPTSKNSIWGRKLLENYTGEHSLIIRNKQKINFKICNSFTYEAHTSDVKNVRLGCADLGGFVMFKLLRDLKNKYLGLNEVSQKEDEVKAKLEELKRKEEEEQILFKEMLQQAENELEFRRLEEQRQAEEEQRLQEIRVQEEQRLQLERERIAMEQTLQNAYDQYKNAVSFIRTQASLRNNPILDKQQNEVKFSHLFDGTVVVIDGGPGTGKTTTLIQRLKFLISRYDLEDHMLNTADFHLTENQLDLLTDERNNWIFFSPTEQLCKYLRSNMEYEGLINPGDKTKVWSDYLMCIIKDHYHFAGPESPFEFKKLLNKKKVFNMNNLKVLKSFTNYYLTTLRDKLITISEIDSSGFSWNVLGKVIATTCAEARTIRTVDGLIRLLFKLNDLKEIAIPGSQQTVARIIEEYNQQIKLVSLDLMVLISNDKQLHDSLLQIVASWETPEEDEDELVSELEEYSDFEELANRREVRLEQNVRALLKSLSLQTIDSKVRIKGRKAQLYGKLEGLIEIEKLKPLADKLYFVQNVYPSFLRNYETFLFSSITQVYKKYRREMHKAGSVEWDKKTLALIIESYKNKPLHAQEQALLVGFINNLNAVILKCSVPRFKALKHKYALAYKHLCRPIIGVDEATDYSLYDYYAMASLKHYSVSSITLTGDLMQCLNEYGLSNWSSLECSAIFPKLVVNELKVSYRQSPELIKLADYIYTKTMDKESPYKCVEIEEAVIPKPLWLFSEDEEEKIEWIIDRILEVKKAYSQLPSIAIFATSENEAQRLTTLMNDSEVLDAAGIEVINCSNGLTDAGKDKIRVFPLKMVKGMEFEVVFFHNIHDVEAMNLLDKYLYVGLSRASFYIGITSSLDASDQIIEIAELFELDGNWKLTE